jgi:hypothetical protein
MFVEKNCKYIICNLLTKIYTIKKTSRDPLGHRDPQFEKRWFKAMSNFKYQH